MEKIIKPKLACVLIVILSICLIWAFTYNSEKDLNFRWFRVSWISEFKNRYRYCYNESAIIFFHLSNTWTWYRREACAFKLAAIHNFETGVCVFTFNYPMKSHPLLRSIENLEIVKLDIDEILADTKLLKWYHESEELNASNTRLSAISDALRYAYLYKYGGKYMDTDSWTLKNLGHLQNVAAWVDDGLVASGVLFFEKRHPFIKAALDEFFNFPVNDVGPSLVTKVHKSGLVDNRTYTLLPPNAFYPVHFGANDMPYEPSKKIEVQSRINGSYLIHLRDYKRDLKPPPNGSFVADIFDTVCSI